MKVQLQLSIEHRLRNRLKNINKQTHIPVSKIVTDVLEEHLGEIEQRYSVQPQLNDEETES